ncbi:response regulator [Colwelliaceae bacterium 6471]
MNILIVDDNTQVLTTIQQLLKKHSHNVEIAKNGLEAFELAQNRTFDLYIVDHLMPVMNGLQLCKNLHNSCKASKPNIIFMTTQNAQLLIESQESGLFLFILEKPINERYLLDLIESVFNQNTLVHSL